MIRGFIKEKTILKEIIIFLLKLRHSYGKAAKFAQGKDMGEVFLEMKKILNLTSDQILMKITP